MKAGIVVDGLVTVGGKSALGLWKRYIAENRDLHYMRTSNISFGLPEKKLCERGILTMAVQAGPVDGDKSGAGSLVGAAFASDMLLQKEGAICAISVLPGNIQKTAGDKKNRRCVRRQEKERRQRNGSLLHRRKELPGNAPEEGSSV